MEHTNNAIRGRLGRTWRSANAKATYVDAHRLINGVRNQLARNYHTWIGAALAGLILYMIPN